MRTGQNLLRNFHWNCQRPFHDSCADCFQIISREYTGYWGTGGNNKTIKQVWFSDSGGKKTLPLIFPMSECNLFCIFPKLITVIHGWGAVCHIYKQIFSWVATALSCWPCKRRRTPAYACFDLNWARQLDPVSDWTYYWPENRASAQHSGCVSSDVPTFCLLCVYVVMWNS